MPFITQATSAVANAPRERLSNARIRRAAGFCVAEESKGSLMAVIGKASLKSGKRC
jgi:hypothetical protein